MLLVRQSLTAFLILLVLCPIFSVAGLVVGGAVLGGMQAAQYIQEGGDPDDHEAIHAMSREVGEEFGAKWAMPIFAVSFVLAMLIAAAISFTGILPWCRAPQSPPSL